MVTTMNIRMYDVKPGHHFTTAGAGPLSGSPISYIRLSAPSSTTSYNAVTVKDWKGINIPEDIEVTWCSACPIMSD